MRTYGHPIVYHDGPTLHVSPRRVEEKRLPAAARHPSTGSDVYVQRLQWKTQAAEDAIRVNLLRRAFGNTLITWDRCFILFLIVLPSIKFTLLHFGYHTDYQPFGTSLLYQLSLGLASFLHFAAFPLFFVSRIQDAALDIEEAGPSQWFGTKLFSSTHDLYNLTGLSSMLMTGRLAACVFTQLSDVLNLMPLASELIVVSTCATYVWIRYFLLDDQIMAFVWPDHYESSKGSVARSPQEDNGLIPIAILGSSLGFLLRLASGQEALAVIKALAWFLLAPWSIFTLVDAGALVDLRPSWRSQVAAVIAMIATVWYIQRFQRLVVLKAVTVTNAKLVATSEDLLLSVSCRSRLSQLVTFSQLYHHVRGIRLSKLSEPVGWLTVHNEILFGLEQSGVGRIRASSDNFIVPSQGVPPFNFDPKTGELDDMPDREKLGYSISRWIRIRTSFFSCANLKGRLYTLGAFLLRPLLKWTESVGLGMALSTAAAQGSGTSVLARLVLYSLNPKAFLDVPPSNFTTAQIQHLTGGMTPGVLSCWAPENRRLLSHESARIILEDQVLSITTARVKSMAEVLKRLLEVSRELLQFRAPDDVPSRMVDHGILKKWIACILQFFQISVEQALKAAPQSLPIEFEPFREYITHTWLPFEDSTVALSYQERTQLLSLSKNLISTTASLLFMGLEATSRLHRLQEKFVKGAARRPPTPLLDAEDRLQNFFPSVRDPGGAASSTSENTLIITRQLVDAVQAAAREAQNFAQLPLSEWNPRASSPLSVKLNGLANYVFTRWCAQLGVR